ncbi:MAG: hydroxysqualene dehydroxylase HpnE [Hylemonella sp.]|uniref:hydroxysqualene dehydroxylase HpnE n=1 Tax=Hylemonella sp. TaxID=2066020 RepID=UPI0022C8E1F4|nr:hydroxysqualene dehydroxylase HpnE [Hylemonella sp.]MCZ8251876.1 hydroxysqualene dehydroxylase HpnE [Hylemonella sp.]
MRVAVIGAGWAGLAAAVQAVQDGHTVTVFEAARTPGGRARGLDITLPDGRSVTVDNGQHILIGAYTESLRLMRTVGIDPDTVLQRLPLTLQFPDGAGLRLPDWPVPLDVLAGILRNRAWPLRERLGLLRAALGWKLAGFECADTLSVAELCATLGPRVQAELIAPLCVSALNTPAAQASAKVFLRVLHDALFAVRGGSQLLLPRTDLGALFPQAAVAWLQTQGATVRTGTRITTVQRDADPWQLDGQGFDTVLLACSSTEAARLAAPLNAAWSATAEALHFEAITTVYAWAQNARLAAPMLALRHAALQPAQFVFDRGQLGGPAGLLACVISASQGERDALQQQVLAQARAHLGLDLQAVQTVVEKRATFACTPGLQRPPQAIAPGLLACGDYVAGPYPATLEGAVRSGVAAARALAR